MKVVFIFFAALISFSFHSYLAVHISSIDSVFLNEYTAFIFSLWPFVLYWVVNKILEKIKKHPSPTNGRRSTDGH